MKSYWTAVFKSAKNEACIQFTLVVRWQGRTAGTIQISQQFISAAKVKWKCIFNNSIYLTQQSFCFKKTCTF